MFFWMYLVSFIEVNCIGLGNDSAVKGVVVIHGKAFIGRIDNDFVCATIDWWPPQKCDWGRCSWVHASLLNLVYFHF